MPQQQQRQDWGLDVIKTRSGARLAAGAGRRRGEDKKQQVVSLLCHIHCVLGPNNGRMRTILMQK